MRRQSETMTFLEAMQDPALFGPWFKDRDSWRAWKAFFAALFGLPMDAGAEAMYRRHTGRMHAQTEGSRKPTPLSRSLGNK
jgi:hypothetical protein